MTPNMSDNEKIWAFSKQVKIEENLFCFQLKKSTVNRVTEKNTDQKDTVTEQGPELSVWMLEREDGQQTQHH